jgi:hypothetical protein
MSSGRLLTASELAACLKERGQSCESGEWPPLSRASYGKRETAPTICGVRLECFIACLAFAGSWCSLRSWFGKVFDIYRDLVAVAFSPSY